MEQVVRSLPQAYEIIKEMNLGGSVSVLVSAIEKELSVMSPEFGCDRACHLIC